MSNDCKSHADQWKKDEAGAWHCWENGSAPPAPPVCANVPIASLSDEAFHADVTLDDMCPGCRGYHLGA